MVEVAAMLGATTDLVFGSSVANMWARPAATLHAGSAVLAEAFPNRFVLGIGPGYPYQAEALGLRYERPLTLMREYVEAMTRPAPMITVAEQSFARILAANRPRMVELADEITDGAHPGLIPAEETADIRARLGPDKLLVVALLVVPIADRAAAFDAARRFVPAPSASRARPTPPISCASATTWRNLPLVLTESSMPSSPTAGRTRSPLRHGSISMPVPTTS
jgi:probable F420-dependent oxidoreductase